MIEDDLDQWGRPKKAARTPIDALPADAQEKVLAQLEKKEEEEAERERLAAAAEARDAERRAARRAARGEQEA